MILLKLKNVIRKFPILVYALKTYRQVPFEQDMIAILHMFFSFRIIHYDELLSNKVLSLKPEFQAKLGHTVSQLYGRIATEDLSDFQCGTKELNNYINNLFERGDLKQVPDKSYIDFILSSSECEQKNIDKLVLDHKVVLLEKQFKPRKNELMQHVKACLNKLLDDPDKVAKLVNMKRSERFEEFEKILLKDN